MPCILGFRKPKTELFKEHITYGFSVTDSGNSRVDGNYYFFNRDINPQTTIPQNGDTFSIAKADGDAPRFYYQSYQKWGMFYDGSPLVESDTTTLWPWDSNLNWAYGNMSDSVKFEFKKMRWSGIVKYNPNDYPETGYTIFSNSDGTMENQEVLEVGKTWLRFDNSAYTKSFLTIQQDEDGYRWYYTYRNYNIDRTYYAAATLEELGWPWDHYDWYPTKRSYWLEGMTIPDFRNMDNIEKVNKGLFNWSINVNVDSNDYTLICNNNDPNGKLMPYCKFIGTGPNSKLYALYLGYGDSDNTFRWIWQEYGSYGGDAYSDNVFTLDNIAWPWDSSITWQERTLTVIKN